jgi:hypothetical protein
LQFFSGLNQVTISGAVATWYWTKDKRALPSSPLLKSFGRALRYHLGSIALGALVIAVVQLIRVFIYSLQRQLRGAQNKAAKSILMCCQCCFSCIEKIVKFLNKNAYIEIAIYGKGFCTSAKNAFQILLRNAFRLVAIDGVAGFVLFLGRLFVASASGCGAYYWLHYYYDVILQTPLNYTSASIVVIMIIGFIVSGVFFFVFDMTIDTIFICFCEDCERNDGSDERPYLMSERLMLMANVKNIKASKKDGGSEKKGQRMSQKKNKVADHPDKVVKTRQAFVEDL